MSRTLRSAALLLLLSIFCFLLCGAQQPTLAESHLGRGQASPGESIADQSSAAAQFQGCGDIEEPLKDALPQGILTERELRLVAQLCARRNSQPAHASGARVQLDLARQTLMQWFTAARAVVTRGSQRLGTCQSEGILFKEDSSSWNTW